jgi:hypothetical protein
MKALLLVIFFSALIVTGCTKLPVAPPPSAPTTVIINGLEWPGQRDHPCYKTANGPNYIDFDGTIIVKYPSRNKYAVLQEVAFSSPTGVTKFPVSVQVNMPNDNSPYKVEIYVKGRDCSRCANRWTGPTEPFAPCIQQLTSSGWEIAYPRWGQINTYSNWLATRSYSSILPDFNVPNTCYTCTVPF